MNLRLIGKFTRQVFLMLKIDGKQYRLDAESPEITVELPKAGTYTVEVASPPQPPRQQMSRALFVLTCFFQGFYNIIFLRSASGWYKKIIPHSMKASFDVTVRDDMEMYLVYNIARYDLKEGVWIKPEVATVPGTDVSAEYEPTHHEFQRRCDGYIRRMISVAVCLLSCTVYLMISTSKNLFTSILASILLVAAVSALTYYLASRERKKMKKLFKQSLSIYK